MLARTERSLRPQHRAMTNSAALTSDGRRYWCAYNSDGTGALPLLRHVILNDDKSSTYKLALLRVLCRIADGAAGYARHVDEEHITVPLGLAALYWVRLFKPLLLAGLPQSPTNVGVENLGFAKEGFRRLTDVSHLDLRIGMSFGPNLSLALHAALRDASDTIARMPAHYMSYPNGAPILPVRRIGRVPSPTNATLDKTLISAALENCMFPFIFGARCSAMTSGSNRRSSPSGSD